MTIPISSLRSAPMTGPSASYRQRLALQPSPSYERKPKYGLFSPKHGYLICDTEPIHDQSSWWTSNAGKAQAYYDVEIAFGKAGILSGIINEPVEVMVLE
jgi:hypothetical protein